jgi:hypothetical protein
LGCGWAKKLFEHRERGGELAAEVPDRVAAVAVGLPFVRDLERLQLPFEVEVRLVDHVFKDAVANLTRVERWSFRGAGVPSAVVTRRTTLRGLPARLLGLAPAHRISSVLRRP